MKSITKGCDVYSLFRPRMPSPYSHRMTNVTFEQQFISNGENMDYAATVIQINRKVYLMQDFFISPYWEK